MSLTISGQDQVESLLDLPDSLLILIYQHATQYVLPHRSVCRQAMRTEKLQCKHVTTFPDLND